MVGRVLQYQSAVRNLISLFSEGALGRTGERADQISEWLHPFEEERLREECQHFLDRCQDRRAPRRETPQVRAWKAHESAFIDDGVDIGPGTQIWHVSHIIKGSKIGKNCRIGQNVVIGPNVTVGDGVKIQNNVSVYDGVTLEDGVFCGPSMVFTNVFNPRSEIIRKDEYKKTLVKRGASIGANATIVCGTTVGRYSFVAAGAVVSKDVPDFALVMGVPARRTGWVCQCGVKLSFSGNDARCTACSATYNKNGDTITQQGI
jgi:UDP-2-acetamido-3-amino-2,3-dideoxy-glucuronate N-acetyltransferase